MISAVGEADAARMKQHTILLATLSCKPCTCWPSQMCGMLSNTRGEYVAKTLATEKGPALVVLEIFSTNPASKQILWVINLWVSCDTCDLLTLKKNTWFCGASAFVSWSFWLCSKQWAANMCKLGTFYWEPGTLSLRCWWIKALKWASWCEPVEELLGPVTASPLKGCRGTEDADGVCSGHLFFRNKNSRTLRTSYVMLLKLITAFPHSWRMMFSYLKRCCKT